MFRYGQLGLQSDGGETKRFQCKPAGVCVWGGGGLVGGARDFWSGSRGFDSCFRRQMPTG